MTDPNKPTGTRSWSRWRVARWAAAFTLLLTPLAMMQISNEWNWTIGDFLVAATMLGGIGLLYEFAERAIGNRAYRAGIAIALGASFLTVWTTLVRDDGNGLGFLLLIFSAGLGAFAAWFRPAGMARTMLGVAVMQGLLGLAVATAPKSSIIADGWFRVLVFHGIFAVLWLSSGACFRAASKGMSSAQLALLEPSAGRALGRRSDVGAPL